MEMLAIIIIIIRRHHQYIPSLLEMTIYMFLEHPKPRSAHSVGSFTILVHSHDPPFPFTLYVLASQAEWCEV